MKRMLFIHKIFSKHQAKAKPLLFIVGFAVIGTAALILTKAATPTASIEPESGTIATGACAVSDAGASGSSAVKFGSCGGGAGLPAGVTLQDIDGGQTYYEQWSNSFPSAREDPTFFPIGTFNNYDISGKATAYKSMGINTWVGLYNGVLSGSPNELTVAKNNGMYALGGPESSAGALSSYGSTMAGYIYQDEAENNTCAKIDVAWLRAYCTPSGSSKPSTASFITMTNQMHSFDPSRPVYNGFTNGFAFDWFLNGNARQLAEGSDIIGYDVYPLVDRRSTFGGQMTTGKPWGTYETVALSRKHADNDISQEHHEDVDANQDGVKDNFPSDDNKPNVPTDNKPIWPDIETSQVDTFNNTCYRPSGADLKALVWNAIIAGARGVTYFDANFASNCSSPTMGVGVLLSSSFSDIRTATTEVNAQVKALAPVINAPFAVPTKDSQDQPTSNGYETHTGWDNTNKKNNLVNSMVKYYNNQFYIFAAPKASSLPSITFTIAGSPSGVITVINENRTIPLSNGSFTDTFANDNTIHIYRVN
jgi:hypothetical protein